jgi:hypothetical protein
MDTQLVIAILGSGGFGSLLALAIKRTWSDRDAVNNAFAKGRDTTASEYQKQIEALREEFTEQRQEDNDRYQAEIRKIELHVQRLHNAVAQLVPLVNPDRFTEAMQILASLSLSVPIPPDPKDTND